jgi:glutamine cyclotransferase
MFLLLACVPDLGMNSTVPSGLVACIRTQPYDRLACLAYLQGLHVCNRHLCEGTRRIENSRVQSPERNRTMS